MIGIITNVEIETAPYNVRKNLPPLLNPRIKPNKMMTAKLVISAKSNVFIYFPPKVLWDCSF